MICHGCIQLAQDGYDHVEKRLAALQQFQNDYWSFLEQVEKETIYKPSVDFNLPLLDISKFKKYVHVTVFELGTGHLPVPYSGESIKYVVRFDR